MAILPVGIGPQEGGYQIERSLRFNSADSAYLSKTFTTPTNNKIFTFSVWVKRSLLGGGANTNRIFNVGTNAQPYGTLYFHNSDSIYYLEVASGGGTVAAKQTTSVYRDTSAWYHIVVSIDTTQSTASNRNRIYVNGEEITSFSTSTDYTQNTNPMFNTGVSHYIGYLPTLTSQQFDGYLTEINFIDGQALDPTSFGEYNSETGVWQPIAYTGSYGTNGFYLNFSDNSGTTSTTLGKDYSGNSNNWTPNNFSVTAGAGNDSLVDTPTPYGTDTGVGGEVRGNYCTMSPLLAGGTTNVNGNLDVTCPDNKSTGGTFGMSSGKWYFEATVASANYVSVGIARNDEIWGTNLNGSSEAFMYSYVGTVYTKGSADTTPDSFTTNDIISVCVDLDNNKLYFLKNGSGITISSGTQNPSTGANGISLDAGYTYFSAITANGNSAVAYFNFGQRPFAYAAPTGFKALCTTNLPDPAIADGSTAFNALIYDGTGSSGNSQIVGFQPDLVWVKRRSAASSHMLHDVVRGVTKRLRSDTTEAEDTGTSLSSFDTTGFTLGDGGANTNASGSTYVAWNWKAGGTGVSNTAGSITSTVSANTTAGFSIVTYTGDGTSGATVGHGLGAAPSMVIVKNRTDGTRDWLVYHKSVGATGSLFLDTTSATVSSSAYWNNTEPTSTVFSLGNSSAGNGSTNGMVAYCFAPVEGYSAFGSYVGNGSADGPFVYTGFRPRFIMVKRTDFASTWVMIDTARDPYNDFAHFLYPNTSAAEDVDAASDYTDSVSNGFKVRNTWTGFNGSGGTYIYAAFAENAFKVSLGR